MVLNILNYNYTLNQPIFKYALRKAQDSSQALLDNKRLMVVGGVATQLTMIDETHLLRPTNDIDFISNRPVAKPERRQWASYLSKLISDDGLPNKGGLSRYGGEVRFEGLQNDLLVHLDCFGPEFYKRHRKRLDAEFERSEVADVNGSNVYYQHPIDIIVNKVRRMNSLNRNGLEFDSETNLFLSLLKEGVIDGIETERFRRDIDDIVSERQKNVEDLGRLSYREIFDQVQGYKVKKDIYDICGVIDSMRRCGRTVDRGDFIDSLKLALVDLE
ncbi:Uncharacterised protein [uncultured archaeon]|nr:Uncharacterised protein [uncultured archaeon]